MKKSEYRKYLAFHQRLEKEVSKEVEPINRQKKFIKGPWFVTPSAVRDYMAITGLEQYETALDELIEMTTETVGSGREPKLLDSGAWRWRGPSPLRLSFIVEEVPKIQGDAPQLMKVLPSHHKKGE